MFLTFPNVTYVDFNQPQVIPSVYVIVDNRSDKFFAGEENLNEEILKLAEKSGSFDFLLKSEEEGYSFQDGEDVC